MPRLSGWAGKMFPVINPGGVLGSVEPGEGLDSVASISVLLELIVEEDERDLGGA